LKRLSAIGITTTAGVVGVASGIATAAAGGIATAAAAAHDRNFLRVYYWFIFIRVMKY